MIPGEIFVADGDIELNAGRAHASRCAVANTGDRPIQVGSHYHFAETNAALAVRSRRGARLSPEHSRRHRRALRAGAEAHGRARGARGRSHRVRIPRRGDGAARQGREEAIEEDRSRRPAARQAMKIGRRAYAEMFGPTVGDRVRLADTDLVIEVERDLTIYGEEVKFGGGKVIRDGMGQSQRLAKDVGRHGDHQRAGRRLVGHRQVRPRASRTAGSRGSARPAIPTSSPASTS